MFDPMGATGDSILQWIVLGLAGLGFLVGWYFIYRSWKDIEDN